jgi:hypothetical protein
MPYYTLIKKNGQITQLKEHEFEDIDVASVLELNDTEYFEIKKNIGINIQGKEFVVSCIWNDLTRPYAPYNQILTSILNDIEYAYNQSYKRCWGRFDIFEDALIESDQPIADLLKKM